MSKTTGLGAAFYIGGNDVSGDINSLSKISGTVATLDGTDITQSGNARLFGHRDGEIDFTAYFDPASAHPVLAALPTTDTQASYRHTTVLGAPVAELRGVQVNYDPTRGNDGSLMFAVQVQGDGFGLEWGQQLTPGTRTDAAATAASAATSIDTLASLAFGGQAYLQVMAFTGTDATVKIQDSADNVTFADVTSFAFTQITSAPGIQRIAIGNTATLRRYISVATVTTGGFSNLKFAVSIIKNPIANQTF